MGNPWFQFKQFRIEQHHAGLKVGTDGVLLGSWCRTVGSHTILDIGTGTGVIALMLAQRSDALVHAVEIDEEACQDAQANFAQSPWPERLALFKADFIDYCRATSVRYDCIVSNPPFFKSSLRSANPATSIAKHDVHLTYDQLIGGASELLSEKGKFSVILPFDSFTDFYDTSRLNGLYLSRKTIVFPAPGKPAKRVLLEFSKVQAFPEEEEMTILAYGNQYTEKFAALTRDFYL